MTALEAPARRGAHRIRRSDPRGPRRRDAPGGRPGPGRARRVARRRRGQGRDPRLLPRPRDRDLGPRRRPPLPGPRRPPAQVAPRRAGGGRGARRRPAVADRSGWHVRPGRRVSRTRRRRHAALVRQRRGVDRRGHDGRQPRARRLVRAGRRPRPPVRGRDARGRARARGRAAGHRGGRRVRRCRVVAARGRARRRRRRDRRGRRAHRDLAALRSRSRPGAHRDARGAARRPARVRSSCPARERSTATSPGRTACRWRSRCS